MAFVGVVVVLLSLIHLYLWWRLVRGTTRPGRLRRVGGIVTILLTLLVPATMIGTTGGVEQLSLLAWPGYLWIAVMFYLLVVLLALELPMLVARLVLRVRARRQVAAAAPAAETVPARVGAAEAGTALGDTTATAEPGGDAPAAPAPGPDSRESSGSTGTVPPGGETPAGRDGDAPDPQRRLLLARGAAIFAGLTATGLTGYGVRTATGAPRIHRVPVPLAKLPRGMDGLRIATVADIHLGPLLGREHTERIVAAVNRLDADLVAIVGDLVDGPVAELGRAAEPLRDLRSRYGSYFVTGNHEYYAGVEEWVPELDRLGLRVLQNERTEIRTPNGVLDLAGVNDVSADGVGVAAGPDYAATLADRDQSRPVVLLAHQPVQAHEAARYGVDLQLSGHTHGGQIVPFNLLVGLEQPVVSGLGEVDGTKVFVTNGAGFWGPPVRVGAPPEVALVELRAV